MGRASIKRGVLLVLHFSKVSASLGIGHSHPLPVTGSLLVPRWWTYIGPDFGKWWPDPPPPSMPAYSLRKNCLPRWEVDGGGDYGDGGGDVDGDG